MNVKSSFIPRTGLTIENHTENTLRLECIICENTFRPARSLIIHYVIYHELKFCRECLVLFGTDEDLHSHESANHNVSTCQKGPQSYTDTGGSSELNVHYPKSYAVAACDLCQRSVDSIQDYRRHLTDQHMILPSVDHRSSKLFVKLKDNLFFCQLCSLRIQFDRFVNHYCDDHSISTIVLLVWLLRPPILAAIPSSVVVIDFEQLLCPFCDQKYTLDAPRAVHSVFCAGMVYCKECDRMFSGLDLFSDHQKTCQSSLDTDVLPSFLDAKCEFCDEIVKFYDRKRHRDVHRIVVDRSSESPKSCPFCPFENELDMQNVRSVVHHYLGSHRMSHACLLSHISPRREKPSTNAVYTVVPPTATEAMLDFDTRMVKFIYSTFEDSSSDDQPDPVQHPFQCKMCDHKAVSKLALLKHMSSIHGFSIKPIEFCCQICEKKFSTLRTLRMHRRKKHWPTGWSEKCGFCDFPMTKRTAARTHIREHVETAYHPCKSRTIGYNCRHCHYTFWTEDQLNDHVMNMHAENVRQNFILCICCAASLMSMAALRSHMQRLHPNDDFLAGERFLFQCEICKINFPSMAAIRKHMKKVHPDLTATFCPIASCAQIIEREDLMMEHCRDRHKSKDKFQCMICAQNYPTIEAVTAHHTEKHVTVAGPTTD